jgi:hypothetical protein
VKGVSDAAVADSAGTVVVEALGIEKEWCRQEHESDMTEYVVGAAAAAVDLGTMSIVDTPEGRKVGLEYMQDE